MDESPLSVTDEHLLTTPITLTNCDREPIHLPGAIQPYGFLLCLDEATQRIVQASANTHELIGIAATDLLGGGLGQVLGPVQLVEVEAMLVTLTATARLLGARLDGVAGQPFYKIILHRHDQLLWLEFEPVIETEAAPLDLPFLNLTLGQMLAADTLRDFGQYAVGQVRAITGFDRVALYRFAADESGEVVAEDIRADLAPWLGLHYPASDIPQQARAMYLKNWLRFIPDAAYGPVPLVPVQNPATGRPPDMTYAVFRSVSPIHLEYLRHMGSAATMTISIIQDGRLWGLITCHHLTPRLVSYELRELCLFIGKTFSALLASKERGEEMDYQLRVHERQAQLLKHVMTPADFVAGLHQHTPTMGEVFDCGGAAICFDNEVITVGVTPGLAQIRELADWLQTQPPTEVFHTNSYTRLNPAGHEIKATASGFIAAALADAPGNYLLWFRPEQVRTVTWAGQHEKPQRLANGQIFLSPRQSFEAWKQLVEGTAAPWQRLEIEAAREIRQRVSDIRLRAFSELQSRARLLQVLNVELERSNEELDAFAYVASHDLKEPLRGIHNYALFLLEDYADRLDIEGTQKLQTLVRLSQRMDSLIESLLQLARVGRAELAVSAVDLNVVLADVRELLQPRLDQTRTSLTVVGPLPTVQGDQIRLHEVFNNLFTNAMRYNDHAHKTITVGLAPAGKVGPAGAENLADFHVFYVRDNGIGIAPKHHRVIFKLFKRLHLPEKYGGGTGAGLAIAQKMVEKHGGNLWVDSSRGHGATFYFSLPKHV